MMQANGEAGRDAEAQCMFAPPRTKNKNKSAQVASVGSIVAASASASALPRGAQWLLLLLLLRCKIRST